MPAKQRLCALEHPRERWAGNEQVYVCGSLDKLREDSDTYKAAKINGDFDAANLIVTRMINDVVVDRIIDDMMPHLHRGRDCYIVSPHPPFDDGNGIGAGLEKRNIIRNALPFQFAAHVSELVGAEVKTEIVQIGRVGRTKLTPFERFLYHPVYDGQVCRDGAYILLDDVCTLGGTLASLRSHILRNDGLICSAAALASGRGQWVKLAPEAETWQRLEAYFGASLNSFWKEEIGHDAICLTDREAFQLAKWAEDRVERGDALIHALRSHLAETASRGVRGKGA